MQDLAAPDDPRPRVVCRGRRDEEGQRGEREDRQGDPIAHGDPRHGERRHSGTGCCQLLRGGHGAARRLLRTRCCPPLRRCKRACAELFARAYRCRAMIRRLALLAWLTSGARPPPPAPTRRGPRRTCPRRTCSSTPWMSPRRATAARLRGGRGRTEPVPARTDASLGVARAKRWRSCRARGTVGTVDIAAYAQSPSPSTTAPSGRPVGRAAFGRLRSTSGAFAQRTVADGAPGPPGAGRQRARRRRSPTPGPRDQ
jgi:hypothetical protein